jgi:hypothetical protein
VTKQSIYEGKQRGGDSASIQLLAHGDRRCTAVRIAGQRRWRLGRREVGKTGQFDRMGWLGSWAGEGIWVKFKDLNRWASNLIFELISRILSLNSKVSNI